MIPPVLYRLYARATPAVTKPYVPPTTPSGLRLPDEFKATHFRFSGDNNAWTYLPIPDTHLTCPEEWSDEEWKERIVFGNNEVHMLTTPNNMFKYMLKVSRDKTHKDKWVYQDFDPDDKLSKKLELVPHALELMSKLLTQAMAACESEQRDIEQLSSAMSS